MMMMMIMIMDEIACIYSCSSSQLSLLCTLVVNRSQSFDPPPSKRVPFALLHAFICVCCMWIVYIEHIYSDGGALRMQCAIYVLLKEENIIIIGGRAQRATIYHFPISVIGVWCAREGFQGAWILVLMACTRTPIIRIYTVLELRVSSRLYWHHAGRTVRINMSWWSAAAEWWVARGSRDAKGGARGRNSAWFRHPQIRQQADVCCLLGLGCVSCACVFFWLIAPLRFVFVF